MAKKIPAKSQHLIIVDPPYFEVKGEFDFIWSSFNEYLKDVEKWASEFKRVLADNGTLFWWGHAKKIAYSQIILDKYFTLCNSLVWKKEQCQTKRTDFEQSRTFAPVTERLLMYSSINVDMTGLESLLEEHIKPNHPFAIYMREEFKKAGVNNRVIAGLFPSKTGGLTGCVSNWLNGDNTPTKEQYLKIREYLNGEYLRKEYEELRKEYEELRKEYEEQRRYFNNIEKYEDVLAFGQEAHITKKYKHDTQKPPKLCNALVSTCSRKGQNCFIPFMGAGVEVVSALDNELNIEASELDIKHFNTSVNRVQAHASQADMFREKAEINIFKTG